MTRKSVSNDRRGAVSVMFAAAAVPMIGVLGLAIDFSVLARARTQVELASDTAALDAAKVASNRYFNGGTADFATVATNAGQNWFAAQVGGVGQYDNQSHLLYTMLNSSVHANVPVISVARSGVTFTANVTYSGSAPTTFSALFGVTQFNFSGSSVASITANAYVNITMLLDNSSSMLIGASTADINTLQAITACSPESTTSGQTRGGNWTGTVTNCTKTYTTTVSSPNPGPPKSGQMVAAACGFACHWSTNTQKVNGQDDYTQWDYFALARNPATGPITGYSAPTLRFDVVQSATAAVVNEMISDQVLPNQFGLGVFMFNSSLTRVYPATGEASNDLASGLTAVQGITTPVVYNDGDTAFPASMTTLASTLTAAGDGSSTSSPRKYLFIVTDGIQDYGSRVFGDTLGPFANTAAVAACNAIKAKGYSIFVLYTPYEPLPYNPYYVNNIATYVNSPPTPNKIVQALQACASSPAGFYEADLPQQVTTGLKQLLQTAMFSPAHITS